MLDDNRALLMLSTLLMNYAFISGFKSTKNHLNKPARSGIDNTVLYSLAPGPVNFKSYCLQNVTGTNFFAEIHNYSYKIGTLYNKIYLFIFRTLRQLK